MFDKKKVMITGAARGIGLELSRALIAMGATVLAVGRNADGLAALAREGGRQVVTRVADLGRPADVSDLINWVRNDHPDLMALINNAAIMYHRDLTKGETRDEIEEEIAINLAAPIRLSVGMLPVLGQNGGALVNVTSGLGLAPKSDAAVYCATKAGLRSFSRSLRDQVRGQGISLQVTDVVMTLVDTTLSREGSLKKYPARLAARDLLAGVIAGKDEVWVEKTRLLWLMHRLSPALAYRVMRGR